jgi:hypothetical protein
MFKLKNRDELIYSALNICHIEGCKLESEKIFAPSETSIIDVCSKHHELLIKEQYNS